MNRILHSIGVLNPPVEGHHPTQRLEQPPLVGAARPLQAHDGRPAEQVGGARVELLGYKGPMAIFPRKEATGTRVLDGPPGRVGDQSATQVLVELHVDTKEI